VTNLQSQHVPTEIGLDSAPPGPKPRGLRWPARLTTRIIRPLLRLLVILRIVRSVVVNRPVKLVDDRGVIVAPKHLSHIDHFFVAPPLRRPVVFVSKREVWDWPVAGLFMRLIGSIPVDRDDPTSKAAVPRLHSEVAMHGGAGLMYGEGTTVIGYPYIRGVPPVGRLKTGVARTSLKTNKPILLVGITGTDDIMPSRQNPGFKPRSQVIVHFDDKLIDPIAIRMQVAPDNPFDPTPAQERAMIETITAIMHAGLTRLVVTAKEAAAEQAAQKIRDAYHGRQLARQTREAHRQLVSRWR